MGLQEAYANALMKTIGEVIRKDRLSLGLTPRDFGNVCHYTTMYNIEKGNVNVSIAMLDKIAASMGKFGYDIIREAQIMVNLPSGVEDLTLTEKPFSRWGVKTYT